MKEKYLYLSWTEGLIWKKRKHRQNDITSVIQDAIPAMVMMTTLASMKRMVESYRKKESPDVPIRS